MPPQKRSSTSDAPAKEVKHTGHPHKGGENTPNSNL